MPDVTALQRQTLSAQPASLPQFIPPPSSTSTSLSSTASNSSATSPPSSPSSPTLSASSFTAPTSPPLSPTLRGSRRRPQSYAPPNTNNPFRNSLCSLTDEPSTSRTTRENRSRLSVLAQQFPAAAAKRKIAQAIARSLSAGPREASSSSTNPQNTNENTGMTRRESVIGGRLMPPSTGPPANRHSYAGGPIGGGTSGIPSHAASIRSSTDSTFLRPPPTRRRSNSWHAVPDTSNCGYATAVGEKPVAVTSGGSVSVAIALAEPVLFLQGFDFSESRQQMPAMLRGSLVVRVNKPTKMKSISLCFRGRARTEWPEGIPPKKNEFFEEENIMTHVWIFFNLATIPEGHGAHCARLDPEGSHHRRYSNRSSTISQCPTPSTASTFSSYTSFSSSESHTRRSSIHSIPSLHSKSFTREEVSSKHDSKPSYRLFSPGEYIYNFELPLDSHLPETCSVDLGSVSYSLEATIERAGAFRPNLIGKKEVVLIRSPAEGSLEGTEPIAINRNWDDQLQYDIVISGKSFPLGSTIPIAFRLTPLAKVRCHRIRIYITENIEYFCKGKKVHRLDPVKKVQLFEKRADGPTTSAFPGSSVRILAGGGYNPTNPSSRPDSTDNLLGDLSGAQNIGPTEMEFLVRLPGCNGREKERIHFDTTYKNIQVHHWIKIVMRLSKTDPADPAKRRHFEISIDSPLQILSCRAGGANTALPAYTARDLGPCETGTGGRGECTCPPAPTHKHKGLLRERVERQSFPGQISTSSSTPELPSLQHPHHHDSRSSTSSSPSISAAAAAGAIGAAGGMPYLRPIHLIRYPSTNPPPFDADVAPPSLGIEGLNLEGYGGASAREPFASPPPEYEMVVSGVGEPMRDYFERLREGEEGGISGRM